jgi:selT/selW/selH-like putative selenoprotein
MTELSLVPYADGRFEVIVGDEKIYSKLETGEFPNEDKIAKQISKML